MQSAQDQIAKVLADGRAIRSVSDESHTRSRDAGMVRNVTLAGDASRREPPRKIGQAGSCRFTRRHLIPSRSELAQFSYETTSS